MIDFTAAQKHFTANDTIMAAMLKNALANTDVPLRTANPEKPAFYFRRIIRSITGQQISVKAAASVYGRLVEAVGGEKNITPEGIKALVKNTKLPVTEKAHPLRQCGYSGQKTKYILYNADIWHEIPVGNFVHMPDEDIITELTRLHGIGRWTAEMFLMSALARPNVFSYGDLGLMQSLFQHYPLRPHWNQKIKTTVNNWSPHRTVASFVLWHQKDNQPI